MKENKNDILVSVKPTGSSDEYQLNAQLNGHNMPVAYIHPECDFADVSDKNEAHEHMEESMMLLKHVTDHHDKLILDHLDKLTDLDLFGCETYNGWVIEEEDGETPYDTLLYAVAKQIAFKWWLIDKFDLLKDKVENGDLPK